MRIARSRYDGSRYFTQVSAGSRTWPSASTIMARSYARMRGMATSRPHEGMLVLDLGQIYNGPYCGLLLGFMGARVLKIEAPEGDVVRRRKRDVEPYPLVMLNSNKESVVLDLKHPDGKALFLGLVRKADVLVANFATGVMDRL